MNEVVKRPTVATIETKMGPLMVRGEELLRGELRQVAKRVKCEDGDYTNIQGKLLRSPQGADRINKIAGINIVELTAPGFRKDECDRYGYSSCTRSVLGIGHSATGALIAVGPMTMTFSPGAYLNHALGKLMDSKGEVVRLGKPGSAQPGENWIYFPVDEVAGLWANLGVKEVATAYCTYLQDRKFADRRCMGILRRNALCQHPGGPTKYVSKDEQENGALVFAWVADDTPAQQIRDTIQAVSAADDPVRALPPGAVLIQAETPDTEEIAAEMERVPADADGPEDAAPDAAQLPNFNE